jgi:hypothetical protein
MKLKDFKEMIISLPVEFNEYDVIYSEIQDNKDSDSYNRIDDILVGIISDDEEKKLCFMGKDSYEIVLSLYPNDDDENGSE